MSAIDITGHVYGQLTVVAREGTRGESALWRCRCACGIEKLATSNLLRTGGTTSCGCLRRAADLAGCRFGSIVVVERLAMSPRGKQHRWLCRCDCGGEVIAVSSKLNSRTKCKHCRCLVHGHSSHTGRVTPTYEAWAGTKKRCYNAKCKSYADYGGRGIMVCQRWRDSFANFLADMGERPSDAHSLDRYPNVNGNYEPSNCRWATKLQQARNTRATKLEDHEADQIRWLYSLGYTGISIATFFGVSQTTTSRIRDGRQRA